MPSGICSETPNLAIKVSLAGMEPNSDWEEDRFGWTAEAVDYFRDLVEGHIHPIVEDNGSEKIFRILNSRFPLQDGRLEVELFSPTDGVSLAEKMIENRYAVHKYDPDFGIIDLDAVD